MPYGVQLDSVAKAYTEAVLSLSAMQEWLAAAQTEPETIPAPARIPKPAI